MLKSLRLQPLLAKIAVGYMAKIVVISGIAYVGICEWKETKAREMEVRMINRKKHEINDIYVKMLRLSLWSGVSRIFYYFRNRDGTLTACCVA
mgnify:CR=1 FL=1